MVIKKSLTAPDKGLLKQYDGPLKRTALELSRGMPAMPLKSRLYNGVHTTPAVKVSSEVNPKSIVMPPFQPNFNGKTRRVYHLKKQE